MSDGAGESFYRNRERTLVTILQDYMNVARTGHAQLGAGFLRNFARNTG